MKNIIYEEIIYFFHSYIYRFSSFGQFGFGTVGGFDFYQRYKNPVDNIAYPASGNALLNIIYGPKIWIGSKKFSVSLEGQVNLGLTSFASKGL